MVAITNNTLFALMRELKKFGLSVYESKAYGVLLYKGPCTTTTISKVGGIPQNRTYDVLDKLIRRGFVEKQEGRPVIYKAVDPEIILGSLEKNLTEAKEKIVTWTKQVGKRIHEYLPSLWVIKGTNERINKVHEIIKDTTCEILMESSEDTLKLFYPDLKAAAENGVSVTLLTNREISKSDLYSSALFEVKVGGDITKSILLVADEKVGFWGPFIKPVPGLKKPWGILTTYGEVIAILEGFLLTKWIRAREVGRTHSVEKFYPRKFSYVWHAVQHILKLQELGYDVEIDVKGKWIKTGEPYVGKGKVVKVLFNPEDIIFNIQIINEKDTEISIGGILAYLEDISAREIIVSPVLKE